VVVVAQLCLEWCDALERLELVVVVELHGQFVELA
jgi:hypothetical protein